MGSKEAPKDYVRLHINVHNTIMAVLRRLAAKRNTSITDQVRRAVTVLEMVERADEAGEILAIVTMDSRGEVISARELRLIG